MLDKGRINDLVDTLLSTEQYADTEHIVGIVRTDIACLELLVHYGHVQILLFSETRDIVWKNNVSRRLDGYGDTVVKARNQEEIVKVECSKGLRLRFLQGCQVYTLRLLNEKEDTTATSHIG